MTKTNAPRARAKLAIFIVNLAELLKNEFNAEQTAAIVIAVKAEGVSTYKVAARWDQKVFSLVGDATREFHVEKCSTISKKSIWQFRPSRSNRRNKSWVEFSVQSGALMHVAGLFLKTT